MEHVRGTQSPLERAKVQERIATYSISLIVGLVVLLLVRAATVADSQSASDHVRIMSSVMTIAQFIVAVATLVLVRHQVSVAVRQMEQSAASELRLQQLTAAVSQLVRTLAEQAVPAGRR